MHTLQGPVPPSSSTNLDIEAMKAANSAAISSNEKIFPIFAKKLASSDAKDFANTTRKLALWLGSEKAYYAAARPKIVELLETALSAFVDTFARHPSVSELGENLRQLVQAIVPFRRLFPENELQSRIQRVILDTELSLSRALASTSTSSPASTFPVHPQPTAPPVPSWPIQPSSSMPNPVKPNPDGFVHDGAPRAPGPGPSELASSNQIKADPSLASPATNALQDPGASASPTIPSKPQPKRARRAELPEEIKARDLDWFKSNQDAAMVNEDSSKASESVLEVGSDTSHAPRGSPSAKKKTARMVPSRRLPRRVSASLDGAQEPSAPASAAPPESPAEMHAPPKRIEDASVRMDVDEHDTMLEETKPCIVQEVSLREELPLVEPPQLAPAIPSDEIKPTIPEADPLPSNEAPFLNGGSDISACRSASIPDTTSDTRMDIPASDSGSEHFSSEPPDKIDIDPSRLQLQSPILPPLVSAIEPPLNLDFRLSQMSFRHQRSEVDANQQRFDGEMSVIHSTQAKPFTHTHTIDIDLDGSIFSKISKWVNRRCQPLEAGQGVCISLACYRLPELFHNVRSEGGEDIKELTSRSSCSWPRSNRLSLYINDGKRETVINLSPPLFLLPNQCVDLSSLMKPGNNTLEIRQTDDLSEYLVVLHAHRPTRAQLAEFERVKVVDERWTRFLDALAGRSALGGPIGTGPPGVVGDSWGG